MALGDLTTTAWVAVVLASVVVGFAKTAIGGAGSVAVVLFAAVLPARESTGALLPLLICADVVAVSVYRRHASWPTLARLVPGVVPGLLLGAWFVGVVDDRVMRATIAVVLLVMTGLQLWQRRRPSPDGNAAVRTSAGVTLLVGVAAGFATMTANAAGPVMTIYLVMAGLPMLEMIGTGAWFFLLINVSKLPLSAALGLIDGHSLLLDAALVAPMLVGAAAGVWLVRRLRQRTFELAALGLGGVASLLLLVAAL